MRKERRKHKGSSQAKKKDKTVHIAGNTDENPESEENFKETQSCKEQSKAASEMKDSAVQTDKEHCVKCSEMKIKIADLEDEIAREKTSKLKTETDLDVKRKRYDTVVKNLKNKNVLIQIIQRLLKRGKKLFERG